MTVYWVKNNSLIQLILQMKRPRPGRQTGYSGSGCTLYILENVVGHQIFNAFTEHLYDVECAHMHAAFCRNSKNRCFCEYSVTDYIKEEWHLCSKYKPATVVLFYIFMDVQLFSLTQEGAVTLCIFQQTWFVWQNIRFAGDTLTLAAIASTSVNSQT